MHDEDDDIRHPIPDACDWTILADAKTGKVFLESPAIAHDSGHYDDALLQIGGNMMFKEKMALAEFLLEKLNRPTK